METKHQGDRTSITSSISSHSDDPLPLWLPYSLESQPFQRIVNRLKKTGFLSSALFSVKTWENPCQDGPTWNPGYIHLESWAPKLEAMLIFLTKPWPLASFLHCKRFHISQCFFQEKGRWVTRRKREVCPTCGVSVPESSVGRVRRQQFEALPRDSQGSFFLGQSIWNSWHLK